MDLTNKDELIRYLQSHGLYTKHSLGQNFLVSRDSLEKIINAAELDSKTRCHSEGTEESPTNVGKISDKLRDPSSTTQDDNKVGGDLVLEVGPGLGTMTEELVRKADEVISIEIDSKLHQLLISNFQFPISNQCQNDSINNEKLNIENSMKIENCKLKIINDDILKVNIPELVGDRKYKVVANIPYYITSKILRLFLTLENKPEMIVVLTQKEVAERICAKAGDHTVLSLSVQAYGEPEIIGIVPASSFFPIPKVNSAILRIRIMNNELRIMDEKELFRLINIGFASKRKTLVNNLSAGLRITKLEASEFIQKINMGENVRAQELSLENWQKLSDLVYN